MTPNANTLYILAWLGDIGEHGWVPVPTTSKGRIVLRRGDEVIEYSHRFNSGNAAWFCAECPDRLRDRLPPPFRSVPSRETP